MWLATSWALVEFWMVRGAVGALGVPLPALAGPAPSLFVRTERDRNSQMVTTFNQTGNNLARLPIAKMKAFTGIFAGAGHANRRRQNPKQRNRPIVGRPSF